VDVEEVEENLRACGKLSDQILVEDLGAQELEEGYRNEDDYEHRSDLGQFSATFSDLNSFLDLEIVKFDFYIVKNVDVCAHKLHQLDEFTYTIEAFPNHEQRVDCVYKDYHEGHFLEDDLPCRKSSDDHNKTLFDLTITVSHDYFVKEEVAAPKCLNVHTANRQPLFIHDNMQDYMFLNFGQTLSLQEEIQQGNERQQTFVSKFIKKNIEKL